MPSKGMRKLYWLFWLILPALLWWFWKDIPFELVLSLLGNFSTWQIFSLAALNSIILLLFSLRWWLILRSFGHPVPFWQLSAYRIGSFAISFLTPGPQFGGEPLQIYVLNKKHQVPMPATYASVVLDRILELLASLTFLAFSVGVILFSGLVKVPTLNTIGFLPAGFILMPVLYVVFLVTKRKPITRLLRITSKLGPGRSILQRLIEIMDTTEEQVGQFCSSKPYQFLAILMISLLAWVLVIFEYWLSFHYLGLALSLPETLFTMVAGRLALILPLPGGVGVLEASQVLAVKLLGFNPAYGAGIMVLARSRDLLLAAFGVAIVFLIVRPSLGRKYLIEEPVSINPIESGG